LCAIILSNSLVILILLSPR